MSSNLKVNTVLPSVGTAIGIGTAGGSVSITSDTITALTGGSERLRINSDGKVGLGTTGSDYALSIREADNNNKWLMLQKNSGQEILQIREDGDNHAIIDGSHASGELHFYTAGVERLRINTQGRLGLNTNNPDTTLTVQSGGDAQMSLKNSSGTTKAYVGTAGAFGSAGTDDLRIRSDSSNIVFGFSGAERLRINSSGRVGINTTSDTFDGVTGNLNIANTNLNNYTVINLSRNTTSDRSQIRFSNPNGNVGSIDTSVSDLIIRCANDLRFDTNSNERLRIASDGDMGVGTNSPSARLHVNGGDGLLVERSAGTSVAGFKNTGASAMNIYFQNTGSTNHPFIGSSNQDLTLGTNNSEKIRITNGGLDPSTDGATDLGNSSKRFRDLYLSSGIFLGGTTSSNELEDYEEGTYVPSTNTGLTLNSGYNTFSYIKIGRCCTVRGLFFPNNNPSGGHNMTISLPFASYNYTGSGAGLAGAGGSGVMYRSISGADAGVAVYVNDNSSTATFYKNGSNGGAWSPVYNNDWNSGLEIYVDFTYFTV